MHRTDPTGAHRPGLRRRRRRPGLDHARRGPRGRAVRRAGPTWRRMVGRVGRVRARRCSWWSGPSCALLVGSTRTGRPADPGHLRDRARRASCVSSVVTDKIGIHAIFGAFLFGAVMPRQGAEELSHEILDRVEQMTVLLLLPVFFIVTGLNVDITRPRAGTAWSSCWRCSCVACVGKFLGASARRPARRACAHVGAASIGILMNTRGPHRAGDPQHRPGRRASSTSGCSRCWC